MLSHGKAAKRLADLAVDQMDSVQNLRKAIYECAAQFLLLNLGSDHNAAFSYKLKVDACEPGSAKSKKLMDLAINYL